MLQSFIFGTWERKSKSEKRRKIILELLCHAGEKISVNEKKKVLPERQKPKFLMKRELPVIVA